MDGAGAPLFDPAAPVESGSAQGRWALPRRGFKRRAVQALVLGTVWLVTSLLVGTGLFLSSEGSTEVAGHEAVVSPVLGNHAEVGTGPVLPDVRVDVQSPIGVRIDLGKTDAGSTEELVARYGLIVSNPEAQVDKVVDLVVEMATSAYLRGAAAGLVPITLYLMLGPVRRREMWHELRTLRPRPVLAGVLVAAVAVTFWQPWRETVEKVSAESDWTTLESFIGDEIDLPAEAGAVEIRANAAATGSKKLFGSVVDTWAKSQVFYDEAAQAAAELDLRQPSAGETVAVFVTDRHDNVGMDRVARALGDAAGATGVIDGGDDTSTGKEWEAFSLDSLNKSFKDLDRWAVTGNHDHGPFVGNHLAELGWQVLDGEVVEGPGGGTMMGFPDPRSSGLGSWRSEKGVSFAEAQATVRDEVCARDEAGERINTLLVHDANLGRLALAAGCADLVIGGHHHVDKGPTQVEGENGQVGFTFTNGTTGGAAYAIAVGSKPKRDAQMTLITYDGAGRPAGLQLVTLRTDGVYKVDDYVEFGLAQTA